MFATSQETVAEALERESAACWRELGEIAARRARDNQRETVLLRAAEDRGDWKRAGFSSHAAWFAQVSRSDYGSALRTTEVAEALRTLPATDEALRMGALTLDQAAALTPFATPATDAELVRGALGKAPSAIARFARTLCPPTVADDAALYKRRELRLAWIDGGRELAISGRLPLEQGVAVEQAIRRIAKLARAADKETGGEIREWRQLAADALVTLATRTDDDGGSGGIRRSNVTLIVHRPADAPPFIEGAGPISVEHADRLTCNSRRLTILLHGHDLVHSRVTRCVSYAQMRALVARDKHCRYPGCTSTHELEAHHLLAAAKGGKTVLENLILLCSRHHKLLHDNHIHTSGTGEHAVFEDETGRRISANQPHAPPR